MDGFDLDRFLTAQDMGGMLARALGELRAGRKQSHWMWFVFPQIDGLGRSETARHYAISSRAEAQAYLEHPELGPRLSEAVAALLESDAVVAGHSAVDVLGAVDSQKLRSSMTLFHEVAPDRAEFVDVLERFFDGSSDPATLELLGRLDRGDSVPDHRPPG